MCIYMLFPLNSKDMPKTLSRIPECLHKNPFMISSIEYTKHYFSFYVCYQNPEKSLSSYGDRKQNSRNFPLKLSSLTLATILLPVVLTSSQDASIFVIPDLPLCSSLPFSLSHCICCCQLSTVCKKSLSSCFY